MLLRITGNIKYLNEGVAKRDTLSICDDNGVVRFPFAI